MVKNVFIQREGQKLVGKNNRQWNDLIEKIIQGEVVPVIEPEFLAKKIDDSQDINTIQHHDTQWVNPHQELINMLDK